MFIKLAGIALCVSVGLTFHFARRIYGYQYDLRARPRNPDHTPCPDVVAWMEQYCHAAQKFIYHESPYPLGTDSDRASLAQELAELIRKQPLLDAQHQLILTRLVDLNKLPQELRIAQEGGEDTRYNPKTGTPVEE